MNASDKFLIEYFANQSKENIENILKTLPKQEEDVLKLRLGFDCEKQYTIEEVAEMLEISLTTAESIEAKAIRKLRHPARVKMLSKD